MDAQAQEVARSVALLVDTLRTLGWAGGVVVGVGWALWMVKWVRETFAQRRDDKADIAQSAACGLQHAGLSKVLVEAVEKMGKMADVQVESMRIAERIEARMGRQEETLARHGEKLVEISTKLSA